MTLIAVVAFASTSMLAFADSQTVGTKLVAHQSPPSPAATSGPLSARVALTPFGLAPQTCVQYVPPRARLLSVAGSGDTILLSDGTQIQVPPCAQSTQAIPSAVSSSTNPDNKDNSTRTPCWWGFGCGSGWIEYATWCYCPRTPPAIYQFDAYWHVPQAPSGHDGQTIFLFSALQHNGVSSYPLAQPVLQWGSAADGGGTYWTVNSWILTSNTNVMYGTILSVNAGDSIQGLMYSTPNGCDANGACDWTTQDLAQPENQGTSLFCGNANGHPACHTAMYDASITLEAYGITWCSDYPASSTTFYGLALESTNFITITPSWGTTVNGDGCGESITNLSASGMTLNY